MGSIMKMFKTNKKHSNKENVPSVTFNTNSLKSKKEQLSDHVYAGDSKKIDLRLKSPYAVVTEPKKTRGPRSCPGAPMDDYNNMSTMLADKKNLMRIDENTNSLKQKKRVKDDSALIEKSRKSEYINGRIDPEVMAYRNMMARQHYDMNSYESDDDEVYEARLRLMEEKNARLENKVQRMHRRMNEERSTMTRQIEMLQEENYRLKKTHDRMHRQYTQMKAQIEFDRKQKSDLLKMLHDANSKIEMLEAGCDENVNDESVNTSSLLCPYNGAEMERSSEGAGEALCFPEMMNTQGFGVFQSMTQSLVINSMPPNSMKDDMDTQDEVRIFRKSEGTSSPVELTRREPSPPFIIEPKALKKRAPTNSGAMTRSHSDTDLFKAHDVVELAPDEVLRDTTDDEEEHVRPMPYTRKSSWIKKNSMMDDDLTSSGSEEERLGLIERQLRKRGEVVKFNPPRRTVQSKHFKRFGKMERSALAEFEYLQDMSTDVSGMMSSPEVNQIAAFQAQQL
ncbi:unnamed protein product [Caenorhabditis bovis]|uniref:Uncharacterized protein n=1 Tax=Caenorhabditis bovis TaxID=2654633 RepID=A0A8S1F118_9PELO|nr:unnamed protein product [Caenorhabditis bovis]